MRWSTRPFRTQTPTGTSYSTVTDGVGSQASTYLVRTTDGGGMWSASRVNPQPKGTSSTATPTRTLVVSTSSTTTRAATSRRAAGTVGDFRTIPFSNRWVGGAVGSTHTKPGRRDVLLALDGRRGNVGAPEGVRCQLPLSFEQFGNRDTPFFGDYNYVRFGDERA